MKRWLVVMLVSLCLAVGVGPQVFAQTAAEKIKAAKMREARDDMQAGFLLAGNGQDAEAVKYFRAAVGLRPNWAEAHSILGSALARTGNYKEAEAELRKAVELKPDYAIHFDASELTSGVYFYTLKTGNFNSSKKMILLK